MSGLVAALVVVWLAVAAAGTGAAGLFWLTPVALAALVVTGAWGVSRVLSRPTHDLSARHVDSHRRAA